MEKVVYILGAGFSAYAGLPLMNDFLSKSKDMYFDHTDKYKHFGKIFTNIDMLSKIKSFYQANMFNIEEILSLMEMQQKLGETNSIKKQFVDYIIDVIEYYSPKKQEFSNFNRNPRDWHKEIFSTNEVINEYGHFVLSLLNAIISPCYKETFDQITFDTNPTITTEYSVITFNYDTVIENYLEFISSDMNHTKDVNLPLYKLHGCISHRNIIPPTWAKNIDSNMINTWKGAFSALVNATQIRLIGYSLPISDSYFRYFLKSSIIKNQRLKAIDIICYDPSGNVKKSYDEFIIFDQKRFQNKKIQDYLIGIRDSLPYPTDIHNRRYYSYQFFERNHNDFMSK